MNVSSGQGKSHLDQVGLADKPGALIEELLNDVGILPLDARLGEHMGLTKARRVAFDIKEVFHREGLP